MELSSHSASQPGEKNPQQFALEQQALEQLLGSGEFHRSPNLEKILSYLCNQYFLGRGNQIKEYTVATEALERREDFDPKRDSIVRVEMHRLRKRLKEYYAGRGANDLIKINIPEKSYVPEFVHLQTESTIIDTVDNSRLERQSWWTRIEQQYGSRASIYLSLLCALALSAGAGMWWFIHSPPPASATSSPRPQLALATLSSSGIDRPIALQPTGSELRILSGRPSGKYPDRYGAVWYGDSFYVGGTAVPVETDVRARGFDMNLFANKREGDFEYQIPLSPGMYELTLFFAETSFGEGNVYGGGESNRIFHIHINGRAELSNFDVLAEAHDPNTATMRLFKDVSPDKDGKLHIRFESSLSSKAFVNAIMIRPGIPGMIRPIRIVCRPNSYRDSQNEVWEADRFYRGGVQITRPTGAASPRDPDLYRGERYGKFSYSIPVPPGKYQARLFFNEYWWGPDRPGLGGEGSRLFDVFCNFRPLLSKFDIYKQNPRSRYVIQTFRGLEPNLDSQLVFDFEPRANYAMLNAIEIADDSFTLPNH